MDTISIIALWFTGLPVLIVIYLMMRQKGLKYLFWNSLKIIIWIGYCVILVKWLGKYEGAILYALLVVVWGWVVTLRGVRKVNGLGAEWSVAKWKFSTDFFLPFTVHGCYCSPGWGVDGRTNGLTPIDGLDSICKIHDSECLDISYRFEITQITKREEMRLKTGADLRFMRGAIKSKTSASGIYFLGSVLIGFPIRILGRILAR